MNFEAHYGGQDATRQARKQAVHVRQYNRWVDIVREALRLMAAQAHTTPPDTCDWVILDGRRTVSWQIHRDYESDYSLNLLPDGRLVHVSNARPGWIVIGTIELRHIQGNEVSAGLSSSQLASLVSNIVSMTMNRFGLSAPADWARDMGQHWFNNHPEDKWWE